MDVRQEVLVKLLGQRHVGGGEGTPSAVQTEDVCRWTRGGRRSCGRRKDAQGPGTGPILQRIPPRQQDLRR